MTKANSGRRRDTLDALQTRLLYWRPCTDGVQVAALCLPLKAALSFVLDQSSVFAIITQRSEQLFLKWSPFWGSNHENIAGPPSPPRRGHSLAWSHAGRENTGFLCTRVLGLPTRSATQREFISSQFWRPDLQGQGVGRFGFSGASLRVAGCLLPEHHTLFSVCVPVPKFPLLGTPLRVDQGPP